MNDATRRYAVVGKPIAHSLSPGIHAMFAAELGLPVEYKKMEPTGDGFEALVKAFFAGGGKGLNVTLPYKNRAFALADARSNGSTLAQAANTLKAEDDRTISACNTDGGGLVRDITQRHGFSPKEKRLLVIGAGGSAAGIVFSLADASPRSICVANRTFSRGEELVAKLKAQSQERGVEFMASTLEDAGASGPFDAVFHTTSAGHGNGEIGIGKNTLSEAAFAYDLSYGAAARPFLELAKSAGVPVRCDGLGMLVEQAALSFAYWEGKMPSTDPVYERLLKK